MPGREVTALAAAPPAPPKRILVNGRPIRLRWLQMAVWGFAAANAGALIISAVYYLVTQVRYPGTGGHTVLYLKPGWDHLFGFKGWDADRHAVRNVYEGALATLLVKSLLAKWQKYGERRVPAWRVATAPLVIFLAALPVVAAGIFVINHGGPWLWHYWFHRHQLTSPVHLTRQFSWLATYLSQWAWQPVLVGIITGQVVHRIYAPVGNTVQLHFIERQADKARDAILVTDRHRPRWPLPPVIRERYEWIMRNDIPVHDRGRHGWLIPGTALILFALAVYGGYVRYWIAKGH